MLYASLLVIGASVYMQPPERLTLDDLSFLVGQWDGETSELFGATVDEVWLRSSHDAMLCTSYATDHHCALSPPRIMLISLWEHSEGVSGTCRRLHADLDTFRGESEPISLSVDLVDANRVEFSVTNPDSNIKSITYVLIGDRLVRHVVFDYGDDSWKEATGYDRAE